MTSPSVCRPRAGRRRVAAAAVLGLSLLAVTACSSDPNSIGGQANAGTNKGYIAGDGTVEQLAVPQRAAPVQLTGTTVTGAAWSVAKDASGKVAVINVWGSWCGPCVEEMPELQKVWSTYERAKKPVAFIGVDINEPPATGASFLTVNGITYPSINNQASGAQPMLALQGAVGATPTTLVLDRQGRIAARVLGATSVGTLTALVDDVLAEKA